MKKIVIGLSGGLDSTTLLAILLSQDYEVHCCSFIYGSKHESFEMEAARKVVNYYADKYPGRITHSCIDVRHMFLLVKSNLMAGQGNIPEGHYQDENMKLTIVPGRNLIFASILASIAESENAEAVGLGVHAGDHFIYPDCRPDFIKQLHTVISLSTDNKVQVYAPLLYLEKDAIIRIGIGLRIPYHLTRTCYKSQELSCGKCGSCNERLEAFRKNGLVDPIQYESEINN